MENPFCGGMSIFRNYSMNIYDLLLLWNQTWKFPAHVLILSRINNIWHTTRWSWVFFQNIVLQFFIYFSAHYTDLSYKDEAYKNLTVLHFLIDTVEMSDGI